MNRIVERVCSSTIFDMDAVETALRRAVLLAGAGVLAELVSDIGRGRRDHAVICGCGTRMESRGLKKKTLLTILGEVPFSRSMFVCPACGEVRYPGDEQLDVVSTTRSPGVRRMEARAGSRQTFKEGRDDLRVYAGIEVSAKDVERVAEKTGAEIEAWLSREREELLVQPIPLRPDKTIPILYVSYDGTGVPMVKQAVAGRKGKHKDGTAKTREVKLGCIFTQTATNEKGFAVRDLHSTSFVGAIETAERFGWRIYAEALRRGLHHAETVVVLGDGAQWIKNLADLHFYGAILIVDLYHARQHVAKLCKLLFDPTEKEVTRHRFKWWSDLDDGKVETIVSEARQQLPKDPMAKKEAEKEIAYLEKNKERMRYNDFRAKGLFVGSGVIEAGCKTVIGKRLKQSGMEWSVDGANAIIALRCAALSARIEDFWESRCA